MKVTFNIECTPEEARVFLGLPDVQPLQEALMRELEERLRANLQALTPESLFSTWLPAGAERAEQMQKLFWSQMQSMTTGATNTVVNLVNQMAEGGKKAVG